MNRTRTAPAEVSESALADLVERFVDRLVAEEAVDLEAFLADHPDEADSLRSALGAAEAMAALRRPSRGGGLAAGLGPGLEGGTLGDYRIIREIGRGGMGVVYLAEQASLRRTVALKVLPDASAIDPRRVARFRLEVQAAAALNHPRIVPIFAVGCERSVHFYAMRFIEGRSLAEAIAGPSGRADFERAARLIAEAAEALEHAHSMGILHRDVKPANLLIDGEGQLWVADFGLAGFLGGGDLTQTGDLIGTIRYLSPEQAEGRRILDPRSDVYGLGATLYELLTLRPAFDGHDRQDLLRRIARDEPVGPRRIDPTIPRDLGTIVARAMAREIADRYGSAGDLAADLRRHLAGRPIRARPLGLPGRLRRLARRHRAAVATVAVAAGLAMGGLAVGLGLLWAEQGRTKDNLRVSILALDEFCLAAARVEPGRDPEQDQSLRALQRKALAIYDRVLLRNPGDPDARLAAFRANHRLANILAATPDSREADAIYRSAADHLARLGPRPEDKADLLGDRGAALAATRPEAQGLLREALAGHRRLALEHPDQPRFRRAIARDALGLSQTIGIARPAEAEEKERLQREAVAIRRSLDDGSFEARRELAEALGFLGHLLVATGKPRPGRESFAAARDLIEGLKPGSATDPSRRRRIIALQSLLATPRYCERPIDPGETLRAARETHDARATLAADFPTIPDFRAELAWSLHTLAEAEWRLDRAGDSLADAGRSVALFDRLIAEHPTVDFYRRWMLMASESLADHLAADHRPADALGLLRRAIEVAAARPTSPARLARLRVAAAELEANLSAPAVSYPGSAAP